MGFESAGLGWSRNLTLSRVSAFLTSPPPSPPPRDGDTTVPRPLGRKSSEDRVGTGGGRLGLHSSHL